MKKYVYIITLFFLIALTGTSFAGETAGSKSKKLDKKSILFPTIPPEIEPVKPGEEAFQIEEKKKVEFERKKTEKELREEKRKKRLEEKRAKEEEQRIDESLGRFE